MRGRKPDPIINRTQMDRYQKRMQTFSKFITQNNTDLIQKQFYDIKLIYYKNRFYKINHASKNFFDQHLFGRFLVELAKDMKIQNIFVGLGSSREMDIVYGFGIIKNIEKDMVTILTTCKYFDSIYLSDLRINTTD